MHSICYPCPCCQNHLARKALTTSSSQWISCHIGNLCIWSSGFVCHAFRAHNVSSKLGSTIKSKHMLFEPKHRSWRGIFCKSTWRKRRNKTRIQQIATQVGVLHPTASRTNPKSGQGKLFWTKMLKHSNLMKTVCSCKKNQTNLISILKTNSGQLILHCVSLPSSTGKVSIRVNPIFQHVLVTCFKTQMA